MKVCFPVAEDRGLDSEVYAHFGSAPLFIMVDTETGGVSKVTNKDALHAHGMCNPIMALDNQQVDAVVVGGIGAGALNKLNQSGIRVYRAQAQSVRENVELLGKQSLIEFAAQNCCAGHGDACGH